MMLVLFVNGKKYNPRFKRKGLDFSEIGEKENRLVYSKFEKVMGFTPEQLKRWDRKLRARCRSCGSKDFKCAEGYPGESFVLCARCDNVIESSFNESSII
jgi:hypothetical protein